MAKKSEERPILGVCVPPLKQVKETLHCQVKPETKAFLEQQAALSGGRGVGKYLDALVARLKEIKR